MEQEKSEWRRDFDNSSKFIQKLALDYTWVDWGRGSMEISDCPKGWQKIVEDLFGAINQYQKTKIHYMEKTPISRFKLWWNQKTYNLARIASKILRPHDRLFGEGTKMITSEMQRLVKETIWWKVEDKIRKFLGKLRFDMSKYSKTRFPDEITIEQIKQKISLRIYTSGGDDQVQGMIRLAEYQASRTCEETGSRGFLCVRGGWYRTLSKAKMKEFGYNLVK